MIFSKQFTQIIFSSSPRISNQVRESILKNTLSLLKKGLKSHPVEVKLSSLPNAGHGVFSTKSIEKFSPICLYPGVYTPPLPWMNVKHEGTDELVYLANKTVEQNNAYVLNLNDVGGSIDANNLKWDPQSDGCNHQAVGHLVNHGRHPNVQILSFYWNDVLKTHTNDGILDISQYHNIPNEVRCDGSPWYLDTTSGEIVFFEGERDYSIPVGGAVLYANTNIPEGSELYLDYMLQKPYPVWAREWYQGE